MGRHPLAGGLNLGSLLLALSSIGLLAAPITIARAIPDLTTRASRHALAGALALTAVAIIECLLARWRCARSAAGVRRDEYGVFARRFITSH